MKLRPLRDWPVSSKVFFAPLMALFALITIGAVSWWSSQQLIKTLDHLSEVKIKELLEAQSLATQVRDFHRSMYQSLVWEAIGQRPDKIAALDANLVKASTDLAQRLEALAASSAHDPERAQLLQSMTSKLKVYRKVAADTLDMKSAGVASAATYVPALDVEYKELTTLVEKLVSHQVASTRDNASDSTASARTTSQISTLAIAIVTALCAALAWRAGVLITQPLNEAAGLAKALAEGDFTRRGKQLGADATGQLVQAINAVAVKLEGVVSEIRSTSQNIQRESDSMSSGNELLSRRTDLTASSVRSAASSIEHLAEGIQHNAAQSQAAAQKAKMSSATALAGGRLVSEVVEAMSSINDQAQKIGNIIKTIDGISFQTNILALNAAVEAARAGEQGRGFAVVATEVRQLAQRSAVAAKEIRTLIGTSIDGVLLGADKAGKAGDSMKEIVAAIQDVTAAIESVASGASEQARCIAEVSRSVNDVDTATQENASLVGEVSGSTQSLAAQSTRLSGLLDHFKTVHS